METTTGPLGQGLANGVGMALAERMLAAQFNQEGYQIVDHHTYVFVGDGCLMEGVSHEVSSLAGTMGLGKLIVVYDDNGISIDGKVDGWFTDDTAKRFESYGWQVIADVNGHDVSAISVAIDQAKADTQRPTIICCRTQIGFGSPNKAGTAGSHGSPLGEEEVRLTRESLGWKFGPFEIPDDVYAAWDARESGAIKQRKWNELFARYETANPELASEFLRRIQGYMPDDFIERFSRFISDCQDDSTRQPLESHHRKPLSLWLICCLN